MKIAVIGYSGSGKSTLAALLGERYGLPVLYLDRVRFLPGWQERPEAEALEIVRAFMRGPDWVIDGNYRGFDQAERLAQADRIVFLSFAPLACLARAVRRYRAFRGRARASMADGCDEKLDAEFVRWVLFGGRTGEKRARYREICRRYADKTVILHNQRQLDAYIAALPERRNDEDPRN